MQLFELVSPRLFRPLAGPNRAFYAELLLLLWEECRHTADYSISRAEAVWRAEDYFAALAKPLALDADGAGDEDEQPTRDPHTLAVGFLLRLRRTGWLEEQPGSYEGEASLAFVPEVAPLLEAHYEQGAGAGYVSSGAATVRNSTDLPDSEVAAEMMQTLPFQVELNSAEPQVLIMHTHTTETYELEEKNWCDPAFSARSTDLSVNMAAVGAEMAAQLNAAGVNTLHDTTLHDYPSYNGSYAKSNATVRSYLERYPSIKVVLDVHRDAIQRDDGTRVKPVADIGGMKAAQVMIICGADVDGNLPNFKQNLRFASRWQDKMESMFPGLTRPVLFDYRYYNQDLTTGSLLIEMGGHANTLEEAKYSGRLVGQALAALFAEG